MISYFFFHRNFNYSFYTKIKGQRIRTSQKQNKKYLLQEKQKINL